MKELIRMERLEVKNVRSHAKVVATLVALGGAILMTLYKGVILIPAISRHHSHLSTLIKGSTNKNWIEGSLMVLGSASACAAFSILQSTTIKKYSAPISLTSLVCFMGSLQTAVVALAMDHNASAWRLGWDIRLFSSLYNVRTLISIKPSILFTTVRGLISSKTEACPSQDLWVGPFGPHLQGILNFGLATYLIFLVVRKKGPVFSSAFQPLGSIMVAIMDLLILGQSLHLGSALGAVLIVVGLYIVLWAKSKDNEIKPSKEELCQIDPSDINYQNQRLSAQEEKA
ncbi:WAT1-related-like protein [Cinnamomum micranthum f. kanehirae]|uniref:WAT1-related-like protein n=1 Tax=Cinnamomum micranthum f. kanehirae TaxID=337451 RepID=A0A3S3MRG2_9MAGN|nr:WAT1-related-like protein [Cinnamomum micranthum f. kanehirae]